MAETINMPKLGFDMAEGTLVRWVKKAGENVNKRQPVPSQISLHVCRHRIMCSYHSFQLMEGS